MKSAAMTPSDDDLSTLADLVFDRLCEQPLKELLDVERALAAIDAAGDASRVAAWSERIWIPLRQRVIERMGASEERLGAWLPPARRAKAVERAGRPAPIPRSLIDELVGSERVREAVRGMINDTLTGFIQKASGALTDVGKGTAGGGGLRGAFSIGARVAGSMIGGIGEEVQSRMMDRVKDHLDGAVTTVQSRIGERLRSEETAKALGRRRQKAVERLLETTEARAVRDAAKVPWAELDEGVPEVIAHNLQREAFREALRADLGWVFAQVEGETVGSLLDGLGLRVHARAMFQRAGVPVLRALLASEDFSAWRATHLRDAAG